MANEDKPKQDCSAGLKALKPPQTSPNLVIYGTSIGVFASVSSDLSSVVPIRVDFHKLSQRFIVHPRDKFSDRRIFHNTAKRQQHDNNE